MNPDHKSIIQRNYSLLTEEILADDIADKLFSNDVINHDDLQRVRAGETDKDKVRRLLDILFYKKGAYEPFLEEVYLQRKDLISHLTYKVTEGTLEKADVKTLAELKELQGEQILKTILTVKVLKVSAPMPYTSKDKGMSQKLEVLIADSDACADVHVYDLNKFSLFKVDEVILLSDIVKRTDGSLVVTKVSNVFTSKETVTVPERVINMVRKKADCIPVLNASSMPVQSAVSVRGKVTHASSPTLKRVRYTGEEVPFKRLKVKDSSGSISVALWRDCAHTPVEKGCYVALHNFTKTQTNVSDASTTLQTLSNNSSQATIEIIPPFAEISDDDDNQDDGVSLPIGNIIGIDDLFTYRCCLVPKCYKKKVGSDFQCPTCREQYTVESAGYGGRLKLVIKHENKNLIFTLFSDSIKQLLESLNLCTDLRKTDETLETLKSMLPIRVKFAFTNDKITKISKF